jgi:hypothetical protein
MNVASLFLRTELASAGYFTRPVICGDEIPADEQNIIQDSIAHVLRTSGRSKYVEVTADGLVPANYSHWIIHRHVRDRGVDESEQPYVKWRYTAWRSTWTKGSLGGDNVDALLLKIRWSLEAPIGWSIADGLPEWYPKDEEEDIDADN